MAGGRGAEQGDARLPGHHRAQPRLEFRARRAAVEHQAGAHHVARLCGEADEAGAILHMHDRLREAKRAELRDRGVEMRELPARKSVVLIRDRQMRREAGDPQPVQRENLPGRGHRFAFPNPDAPHARVDFQMHRQRLRASQRGVGARFTD